MNNQWVTPGGDPIDSDWAPPSNPMPPSNDWNDASGCNASSGPAIVDGITITGVPAQIVAPNAWGITLNDGAAPPNFSIDHYDANGALIEHPIAIDGVSGDVTLTHDPTQELGAATKRYVDENAAGIEEAPIDNTTYGRDNGTWVPLPQTYLPEAPNTTQLYGRFNSIWALVPIQADAPNDGGTYSRQNGAWTPAVVGGPYLPLTGGTMTGPLYMQGSNMIALNSPLSGGQSAILGQKAGLNRWQLMLGDYTTEGLNNVGSNFSLVAFSTTGPALGTWLSIARADGATTFNGSGVTIQGGLAVNGLLILASPNNLAIYGGAAGDVLSTNGSGVLSWVAPSGGGGGGIPDAPSTGQTYGRNNAAWTPTVSFPEAPPDGQYYARRQLSWQAIPPGGATISDTAPASPSVGQLWWDSIGGQLYTYYNDGNSSQWVTTNNGGPSLANYLPLIGGTLTGPLVGTTFNASGNINAATLSAANVFSVNSSAQCTANAFIANVPSGTYGLTVTGAAGTARALLGQTAGVNRWNLNLANGTPEGGSNSGSDFSIGSYNDAGAGQGSLQIQRASMVTTVNATGAGGWTGTGAVGDATLMLNKATATLNQARIFGLRNGVFRWAIGLGAGDTESGSNTGSSLNIVPYTDAGAGTGLATPLTITRNNSVCTFGVAIVNGPSDRTLKENIAPLEGALDKVLALQGVSFNLIATPDKREIGLIAQDVEPVVPEIIQEYATSEIGEDGELKAAEPKLALDYPKLTALLIEAVKTLTARIEELEARLA